MFMDADLSAHLHGEAYRAIRNPAFSDFRIIELVNMEASEQVRGSKASATPSTGRETPPPVAVFADDGALP